MAKKKSAAKKAAPEKSLLDKIAEQAGHLAGELSVKKDHLVEMASDAIASVKSTLKNIGAKKPAAASKKKTAVKKTVKKKAAVVTKKVKKAVAKKAAPVKKTIKKVAKKATAKK